jgi:hypothetical protein
MSLAVMVFVALLAIGVSNRTPVHPGAITLLIDGKTDSVECRESAGASNVLDASKPSRTANFSLRGTYECYRPIFTAEERDPYVDRVLEAEIPRAKSVAAALQQSYREEAPLAVVVEGDADDALLAAVAAIYRAELLTTLGPSHVSRFESEKSPALIVELHRVDVPQLMSRARLRFSNSKGAPIWRDI